MIEGESGLLPGLAASQPVLADASQSRGQAAQGR